MHTILTEAGFADSVWCKQILQGLTSELKKRREPYSLDDPAGLSSDGTVYVVGTTPLWLSAAVGRCNALGIVPVLLCNSQRKIPGGRYHCVCSDIAGSMRQLTVSLKQTHGHRIALYGINPDSVGDRSRAEAFRLECDADGIFENHGSLADCYHRFLPRREQFDAVICANGFAAISLYQRLTADGLTVMPLISCAQTLLGGYYQDAITSVDMNYAQFGRAALAVADLARKQSSVSEITVTVEWSMTPFAPVELPVVTPPPRPNDFYSDEELQQMLRIENLLASCDEIDSTILSMLLSGSSYTDMAERCFLTEGAVKYRIRQMRQTCQCPDRRSLEALLHAYIP